MRKDDLGPVPPERFTLILIRLADVFARISASHGRLQGPQKQTCAIQKPGCRACRVYDGLLLYSVIGSIQPAGIEIGSPFVGGKFYPNKAESWINKNSRLFG